MVCLDFYPWEEYRREYLNLFPTYQEKYKHKHWYGSSWYKIEISSPLKLRKSILQKLQRHDYFLPITAERSVEKVYDCGVNTDVDVTVGNG